VRPVGSATFKHAEISRRMLVYLGEQTLEGRAGRLKEYTVGVEAFGKPPDYDPKTDSSVRVQLSNFREKLDEYYRGEGANDPVVIEVPSGHFKLAFPTVGECSTAAARRAAADAVRRWRLVCLVPVASLAGTVVLALHWRSQAEGCESDRRWAVRYWSPALKSFWRPYLKSGRHIMVSLGTPRSVATSPCVFRNPKVDDWHKPLEVGLIHTLQRQFVAW